MTDREQTEGSCSTVLWAQGGRVAEKHGGVLQDLRQTCSQSH